MNINQLLQVLQQQYPDWEWSVPPDLSFGILTTNQAFRLVKNQSLKNDLGIFGITPKEIAEELAVIVQTFGDSRNLGITATAVGAYVNLDLDNQSWSNFLNQKNLKTQDFVTTSSERVMLEYIGTNVAKKFHAGHMRNLNIGDSLRRILKLKYPQLITDNHWGDWGVNMGAILWGWKQQGSEENYEQDALVELSRVYVWANAQETMLEDYKAIIREEFRQLENQQEPNYSLWKRFIEVTKQECKRDIAVLGVPYTDIEQGESFYQDEVKKLWDFMEKAGLWQSEGEARFVDFEPMVESMPGLEADLKNKFKSFGRCYLVSSGGNTSYAFRDIAARIQWARDFKTTKMITITANEQIHHFNQFFAICHLLAANSNFQQTYGLDVAERLHWHNLTHIAYGFLTLESGKMSSRSGTVLTIKNLFNEVQAEARSNLFSKSPEIEVKVLDNKSYQVTLAALKWYDLNRGIGENLVLNIPTILQFEGNTGVYQLYTLARINSILIKNNFQPTEQTFDFDKLNPEEALILAKMFELPIVLDKICSSYKPHLLCTHLFELATAVNSWYAKYSVSGEADLVRQQSMLQLCARIKQHFWFGLDLLGIQPTDSL